MDTSKWVTLLAGVLFLGAFSPAEACKCIMNHLQNSYCNSDLVLKLEIDGATMQDGVKGYKVKLHEALKGSVPSLTFIDSMSGTSCEYVQSSNNFRKLYLMTASNTDGNVKVSGCSYSKPWSELSNQEKMGVEGAYKKGCACAIVSCPSKPCSKADKTCTIDEYKGGDAQKQLKKQVCVPVNPTTCRWKDVK